MCSPNNKYPTKPDIPPMEIGWDDPMRTIPVDLLGEHVKYEECGRCGAKLTEDEVANQGVSYQEAQEKGLRTHNCVGAMRQIKAVKRKVLKNFIDQPPVRVILGQRKGPRL